MPNDIKDKIKELLSIISSNSYLNCENEDIKIATSSSQINTAAFELRQIIERHWPDLEEK